MITTLLEEDFPLHETVALEGVEEIAARIHAQYRSQFTLVMLLPRASWFGIKLGAALEKRKAHCYYTSIGTALRVSAGVDGVKKPEMMVIEPPSVHAIKDKKVVIFDSVGEWGTVSYVAMFLTRMQPSTVEVGSFFTYGELPKWVNPDYVMYRVDPPLVVSGLGVGYSQEEIGKNFMTVSKVEEKKDERVESDGDQRVREVQDQQ